MSAPTLQLTFLQMQIRVAEFLGIASYAGGAAAVPSDAHDLDLVKRLVNDGYRRFITSYHRWQFLLPTFNLTLSPVLAEGTADSATNTTLVDADLGTNYSYTAGDVIRIIDGTGEGQFRSVSGYVSGTGTFTVSAAWTTNPDDTSEYEVAPSQCVTGDATRYYMPKGFFGELVEGFTYERNGAKTGIEVTSESIIRSLHSTGVTTADPRLCCVRAIPVAEIDATDNRRWELIVYPTPATAYTITGRGRIFPDQLVNNTDVTVCGFQHDEAVLALAYAEAELQRDGIRGERHKMAEESIERAIALDKNATPRRLGHYGDGSDGGISTRRPWYSGVDTYNGQSVGDPT